MRFVVGLIEDFRDRRPPVAPTEGGCTKRLSGSILILFGGFVQPKEGSFPTDSRESLTTSRLCEGAKEWDAHSRRKRSRGLWGSGRKRVFCAYEIHSRHATPNLGICSRGGLMTHVQTGSVAGFSRSLSDLSSVALDSAIQLDRLGRFPEHAGSNVLSG